MTTPNDALDLLKPWIRWTLGDPAPDPQAQLDALRAMLPGRLPDDYAAVLLALKQGVSLEHNDIAAVELPPPRIPGQFTYVGENPEFSKLYGLGGGPSRSYTVPKMWEGLEVYMPKGLVPIGDSLGDQICLDVSEAGNGRIFYWWHEGDPGEDEADGHPGWGNTFLLAHSFTDLCARLVQRLPAEPSPGLDQARICWTRP
jgi:hypothetical protein